MRFLFIALSFYNLLITANSAETIHHDFLKVSETDGKIEYFWSKPNTREKLPLLVLLHPHQEWPNKMGGEVFVKNKTIESWVDNGFITVAVSMPGYGLSTGPSDFCGPITQKYVEDVIDHFVSTNIIKDNKIFLYGGSRGAVVASLLATRKRYAGVVLKSGLYDFEEAYDSYPWYNSIKLSMIWELGFNNRSKLKERSVIHLADRITSPILLIHGAEDSRASIEIAQKFSKIVERSGTPIKFITLESEHFIPMDKIKPYMEDFFKQL